LSPRDRSLLRLLSWTPATTAMLVRASIAFEREPFADERRLRERLQALSEAGIVRSWPTAYGSGGLQNSYKITPLGFQLLCGEEATQPPRAFFAEVAPSSLAHTFRLAEVIVETLVACHARQVSIQRFFRENELEFRVGDDRVLPDAFLRISAAEKPFNIAFEIDNSTESIDSFAASSVRRKLAIYHAYQQQILAGWLAAGKRWERPRFRVVFLTQSAARAYHVLSTAARTTQHPSRRLVYAATLRDYVTDANPLFAPLFLDHLGHWQALIDLHPTAPFQRTPVRLTPTLASPLAAW
jgi:hypothetical protein